MTTCSNPALSARLHDLCFDLAGGEERAALEAHLLECEACWAECDRLTRAVEALRAERDAVTPLAVSDLIQLTGLAAAASRFAGGHARFAYAIAIAYGLMVALALLVEIAYQWPQYPWAPAAGAAAGMLSSAVALIAFEWLRRRTVEGRHHPMWLPFLLVVGVAAAVALAIARHLSAEPIVLASFQTMTARVGWIKSVAQALEIPLLAMVPFQFVLALQRELAANRIAGVIRLLTGDPRGVTPRATLYVRPAIAGTVFVFFAVWWILGSAHLFDNLRAGPYHGLFLALGFARTTTALAMLLTILIWYLRTLNEVKREALAILEGRSVLER